MFLCLVTGDSFDPSGVSIWVHVASGAAAGSIRQHDVPLGGRSLCDVSHVMCMQYT